MARVLIVGCGDIGLGLARVLIAGGHQVTGLKRTPLSQKLSGLKLMLADITAAADLSDLPTNFDQVFVILSPDGRDEQSYRRIFLQGVNNLLAHFAQGESAAHWIFVSSTSVYGQHDGEWVDEGTATAPESGTAKILLQAEQNVLGRGHPGRHDEQAKNTIVRFSGIYGPGREGLLRRVQAGVPVQYEPPYYTNRIHRDDCIGVLAWLLAQRLAGQRLDNIYLATDNEPATAGEVSRWLAENLQCPLPPAKQVESLQAAANKRCCNQKLRDSGYDFRVKNYREGYGLMLV